MTIEATTKLSSLCFFLSLYIIFERSKHTKLKEHLQEMLHIFRSFNWD